MKSKFPFRITKSSRTSRARTGVLRTPHGIIRTPAYVIVATHAEVRTLTPADIKRTKTQLVIANTYHLWNAAMHEKRVAKNEKRSKSYLEQKLGLVIPTMTDSGGFQVFSLGGARGQGVGKVLKRNQISKIKDQNFSDVRITEKGVHFTVNGEKRFISPETSIATQHRLGADIIFAFDECTSPLHPHAYTKASMNRTHRWAVRCLDAHTKKDQMLYGIVQGGRFKRLRVQSAKTVGAMAFDGFGIGGSFGRDEMRATLASVIAHLPDDKPRHLLGIGTVADIFDAVEAGVDSFDCVIPTREARHGKLYTDTGPVDIRKIKFAADRRKLLVSHATFGSLHRLFRFRDNEAGRLATLHNVRWFNLLLERIRTALADGSYRKFKRNFLSTFLRQS